MAQIIQVCSKLFIIFFLLLKFEIVESKNQSYSVYGSFLSWNYAEQKKDFDNLEKFFYEINIDTVDKEFYEKLLFHSVVFNDWKVARFLSSKILRDDNTNIFANFYLTVDDFLMNKPTSNHLEKIDLSTFDYNFIRAVNIWLNFKKKKTISIEDDCIPIICLHSALFYKNKKNVEESDKYFKKIEQQNFSSFRLKEILILNALDNKNLEKADLKNEELKKLKINFQNHSIDFLEKNKILFNPVFSQKDGLAEVFYNISSWYYSNNFNMYAAFFGQLSIRLRDDFNAMNLLLSGILNDLNFDNLALNNLEKLDEKNLYFYKIFKMRLAFLEKLNRNKIFLREINNFVTKYPNQLEMKKLLADKYRKLKEYKKAIDIYSQLITVEKLENRSDILYSRGISFERIDNWEKAEKDFKSSLKLNPNDPYVMNYLAYSWLDRKIKIQEALELLKKAVNLEPLDGYIMDSLGWAYYMSKNFQQSIYHLEKAVSLLPDDATLNDHLGDAYWMSGRKLEAKSQWKKVLLLDPNYKEKERIKKKIQKGF